jgi:hypothetical protein
MPERLRQRQRAATPAAAQASRYADAGTVTHVCMVSLLFGFIWVYLGFTWVLPWFLSVFGVGWSGDVKGWGSLSGEGKPVVG